MHLFIYLFYVMGVCLHGCLCTTCKHLLLFCFVLWKVTRKFYSKGKQNYWSEMQTSGHKNERVLKCQKLLFILVSKNSNSKTKIKVLKSFHLSSRATYHLLPITLKGWDLFPTHTEKGKTIKNLVINTNHQNLQENHRIEKCKSEETCSSKIFWEGKNSPVSGCSWEVPVWLPALTQ